MTDKSQLINKPKESIADRVKFGEREINKYIDAAFPKNGVVEYTPLPYAFSNKTYKITIDDNPNRDVVLKVSVVPDRFGKLASEVSLLKKLNKELNIPIPEVLHEDLTRDKLEYPFCVLSYLHGENLFDCIDSVDSKERFGEELAEIVAQLHTINYANVIELGSKRPYPSWHDFIKGIIEEGLFQMRDHQLESGLIEKVEKYFSVRIFKIDEPERYSLVHRDIKPQNIRFDVKTQKISGVVDFESALTGDRYYDFSFIDQSLLQQYQKMGSAFFQKYSEIASLDENYKDTVSFYNLFSDLYYLQRDLKYREMDRVKEDVNRMRKFFEEK